MHRDGWRGNCLSLRAVLSLSCKQQGQVSWLCPRVWGEEPVSEESNRQTFQRRDLVVTHDFQTIQTKSPTTLDKYNLKFSSEWKSLTWLRFIRSSWTERRQELKYDFLVRCVNNLFIYPPNLIQNLSMFVTVNKLHQSSPNQLWIKDLCCKAELSDSVIKNA